MRRLGLTTWIVLALCTLVGVVAIAMTVTVIVRLNRQVLASAAELRTGRGAGTPAPGDTRAELVAYVSGLYAIEQHWSKSAADFRVRYPNDPIYQSVATAQVVQAVNDLRRPGAVGPLHERVAQAWSDRDAALALLARPTASATDRTRAAGLARTADDDLRRVRNELRDLIVSYGISEPEVGGRLGG